MKVLMYAPIFPPMIGGPATQSWHLCRVLNDRGVTPVVVTVGDRFELSNPDGYTVYRYRWRYTRTPLDKPIRWLVGSACLAWVIVRERPDILHAHSVSALSFVAGLFAKIAGMPSIIKFAGDWVWETYATSDVKSRDFGGTYSFSVFSRFLTWIERHGLLLFSVVWAPSQFRAKNIRAIAGEDASIRIIPNALDIEGGGYKTFTHDSKPVVVSANRFIPHKRIPTIIRAFAKAKTPHAHLVLIGDGQDRIREESESEAKRLRVPVTFTGRLSSADVYAQFQGAALYVSASLEEGFPNVFIEAMHFGLPIVSTDVGGCSELVQDGITGFLVDPSDEDAFSEKIRELLVNLDLRNKMAKSAYERSKQFQLTNVVNSFITLYEDILTAR